MIPLYFQVLSLHDGCAHILKAGDMWQLCGADPARRFTWDMAKNDNLDFGGDFQPRARYDRCLILHHSLSPMTPARTEFSSDESFANFHGYAGTSLLLTVRFSPSRHLRTCFSIGHARKQRFSVFPKYHRVELWKHFQSNFRLISPLPMPLCPVLSSTTSISG